MALKSLISIVLAGAALTVGAQAAFAMSDASDRATQSQVGLYPDAIDRAVNATLASQSTVNRYPDAVDRAVVGRDFWNYDSRTGKKTSNASPGVASSDLANLFAPPRSQVRLVGHIDRYELDLPTGNVAASTSGSGREIEWPQLGIGFGVGLLLALGLFLAVRMTRIRPLAH
jgi:hypothetical protein